MGARCGLKNIHHGVDAPRLVVSNMTLFVSFDKPLLTFKDLFNAKKAQTASGVGSSAGRY